MPCGESSLPGLCSLDINAPPFHTHTSVATTIYGLQTLHVLGRECWFRAVGVTSTALGIFLTLLAEHV